MKKSLILLAMVMTTTLIANAQTPDGTIDAWYHWGGISQAYTVGNHSYIYYQKSYYDEATDTDYDTVYIINAQMQVVKTLSARVDEMYLSDVNRGSTFGNFYRYSTLGDITLTQTLFNNDDKWEYYIQYWQSQYDGPSHEVGGDIVSEDGTLLFSYRPEDGNSGYICGVVVIDNEYYIYAVEKSSDISINLFFHIDRQTQSITRVENVPFNVFPTVADRNSDITVQLEEGTNVQEIVVVDAMGREVKSVPVAEGQREVKVSTSGLAAGMGFVSDRRGGAAKIIVR